MATTLSPNINWPTFAYCNENPTNSFESMTRRLFTCHFLKNQQLPHTEHNTPGIEVAPILEPPHADGTPQRRISFQSKYFDQESVDYGKIQDSARKAVKYYAGKLDAIYLFSNKTTRMNHSSASMLSFVDEKPIISAPDKTSPEVWEAIIEFCENCTTQIISDEERIGFRITDELTGERFISGIHLHSIHLDALILASREKATYLCDDLFFRKLADWLNIRNLNFVSLLQHYVNPDHVAPLIMELSKTNYICIPFYLAFLSRSNIEIQELCKNILTGSKKKPFYSNLIQRYSIAWEQTMRELFGCEYAEPRETEASEQDDK